MRDRRWPSRAFPDSLTALFLVHEKHIRPWRDRLEGIGVVELDEVMPADVPTREHIARRIDHALDRRIGFYPLAIRHSQRHGFHDGRWAPGHTYPFLDTNRAGRLPRWRSIEKASAAWHLSRHRYVPASLVRRMQEECDALVLTNPQTQLSTPFLAAARRLHLPTVGYIASWDHPVGKGIVSPYLDSYVVQNETMRNDLRRFHGVDTERVTVTGWPPTRRYHRHRTQAEYADLLARLGLAPDKPVVLYAGNAPHNMPYQPNLVARLVSCGGTTARTHASPSASARPPTTNRRTSASGRRSRTPGSRSKRGAGRISRIWRRFSSTSTRDRDRRDDHARGPRERPADDVRHVEEGAPPGRTWAELNLLGVHYRALMQSDAILRAANFDELVEALGRSLSNPRAQRRAQKGGARRRRRGRRPAAGRVVQAICASVGLGRAKTVT